MSIQRLKLVYCFLTPDEKGELVTYAEFEHVQVELTTANEQLREIGALCNNCRNLSDAQEIAYGKEDTSTESGCDKCWVEQLQAELVALQENTRWVPRTEWSIEKTGETYMFIWADGMGLAKFTGIREDDNYQFLGGSYRFGRPSYDTALYRRVIHLPEGK